MTGILNALIAGVSGAVKDAYFNLVSLLLPGDGTNGAQNNTFLDGSSNTFTITRNGNTTQGTFSPFSQTGWSSYSAGGSGNYWTVGGGMPSGQGTAFTLECWIYVTDLSTYRTITRGDSAGQLDLTIDNTGLVNIANTNTANICQSQAAAVQANRWHHIMVTRTTGNVYRIYVDGVGGTASSAYNTSMTANPRIGYNGFTQSYNFVGYISNFRVTNTLVQSNNFTPPTTPLTAISGTQLLIFQSNRFVDNSGNSNSIAPAGTAAITPFSPFAPTAAYTTAAVGGSGYFDGNSDYLTGPTSNAAFDLGTGAYTLEAWVYLTSLPTEAVIFNQGNATNALNFAVLSSAALGLGKYGVGGQISTSSGDVPLNSWTHVAIVRTSTATNDTRLYVNGVLKATGTDNNNWTVNTTPTVGGLTISGYFTNGYISSLRVVKGTAVYTSAFTPPTAPLTAVSGTSLLLNFTNAGVVDATAKNVLETVGNAQISTTQSKWGGGSIAFDGTSGTYSSGAPTTVPLGSGDFVVECWVYLNASKAQGIFDTRATNTSTTGIALYLTSGNVWQMVINNAGFNVGGSITNSVWTHVAVVRTGSTLYVYVAGSLVNSSALSNNLTDTTFLLGTLRDNADATTTWKLNGYVDDLRITKGYNRGYTGSTITVPSAQFPVR